MLTFAIPFYGERVWLEVAVHSVLAQSTGDWQLVVCDNASRPQGVAEWLEGFQDSRIRYRRVEDNIGIGGCFNWCLDESRTPLVTLLHHDDFLLPDYAAAMAALAGRHADAVGVFCAPRIVGSDGQQVISVPDMVKRWCVPKGEKGDGDIVLRGECGVAKLLRANFICGPTVCFRRSLLGGRRFDPSWRQVLDTEFHLRLLLEGERLVGVRCPHYAYRRHSAQTTRRHLDSLAYFAEESRLYDQMAADLESRGWQSAARIARRKRMLKLHLAYQLARDAMGLRLQPLLRKARWWITRFRGLVLALLLASSGMAGLTTKADDAARVGVLGGSRGTCADGW
jgi:glycosyltransferase involved in cell wall biosynthesis